MPKEKSPKAPLSARELEVIHLAVQGLTDKEICRKLGITLATIRTHWVRLREKQGTVNRAEAVANALYQEYQSATASLRASEERYRAIVDGAKGHAIYTMDLERRVTSWNPAAQSVLGYTDGEILGQSGDVIFTPEDREKAEPEKEALVALEEGRAADVRWHARKDGVRFWANGYLSLLRDSGGEPQGFIKVMRDDTERHLMEERLRAFVRQSEEGITCFELREPVPLNIPQDDLIERLYTHATLVECNPALPQMCGYGSCEDMVGKALGELLAGDDPTNQESLRELVRTGFRASGVPTKELDQQGHLRPFVNRVTGTVQSGQLTHLGLVQSPA